MCFLVLYGGRMTILDKLIANKEMVNNISILTELNYRIFVLQSLKDLKSVAATLSTLDECSKHFKEVNRIKNFMLDDSLVTDQEAFINIQEDAFYIFRQFNVLRKVNVYKSDIIKAIDTFTKKWYLYRQEVIAL